MQQNLVIGLGWKQFGNCILKRFKYLIKTSLSLCGFFLVGKKSVLAYVLSKHLFDKCFWFLFKKILINHPIWACYNSESAQVAAGAILPHFFWPFELIFFRLYWYQNQVKEFKIMNKLRDTIRFSSTPLYFLT